MASSGHSEEWPIFKPLFALTTVGDIQRTLHCIIHPNDIFVKVSAGFVKSLVEEWLKI